MRPLPYTFLAAGLVSAGVACGSADASLFGGDGDRNAAPPSGSGGDGAFPGTQLETARGIVLAHAAIFPTMRLCFENHPDMKPQPETTTMPQSNVVGIEIGNIARIAPLTEVGAIYVIDESRVRVDPNRSCKDWLCSDTTKCLRETVDFHKIPGPRGALGASNVDVLSISGCGSTFLANQAGSNVTDCGPSHTDQGGNLVAKKIPLVRDGQATNESIPARVLNLSERLELVRGGNDVTITFGNFSALDPTVAKNPPLFETSPPETLDFKQNEPANFAQFGFRATIPNVGEVMKQSLASVQETSSPLDVPSTYFSVASNYALLLLGDPRIRTNDDAGAPNPTYDLRKGLHVIAVPVLDPATLDAGTEGGAN